MKLAREWLRECEETYRECQPCQEAQLPTRVIDIDLEGENPPDPQRYISNGENGKYVTLSHC